MAKYNFYSDPGHGWVRVRRTEVETLGIANKITRYSYQRGLYVYLEEDCDLATFVQAKNARGEHVEYLPSHANKSSKVRSYERFSTF